MPTESQQSTIFDHNVTEAQLNILWHTLGLRPDRREPFRNHFLADAGHHDSATLEALRESGLMTSRPAPAMWGEGTVYVVTDRGEGLALRKLPMPPKRTKYDQYLREESTLDFHEWLGIEKPRVDSIQSRQANGKWQWQHRMQSSRATGEWSPTQKEAKASYKAALKAKKEQEKAFRAEWYAA